LATSGLRPNRSKKTSALFRFRDDSYDVYIAFKGKGEIMAQYLVAIHHPDDFDPSTETEAIVEEIHALNREMIAAGARKFVAGLTPVSSAKSLRAQPGGKVLITDGPYLETKEHIAGFWVLEAADMDEALAWGRKAVLACRAPVEVRPIFFMPAPTLPSSQA
jgi:hypothetical protein